MESTRKINITLSIPDNDLSELNVHKFLESHFEKAMIDFTVLDDTSNMYEKDTHFKELSKKYYQAKKVRNDYINEHNFKYKS